MLRMDSSSFRRCKTLKLCSGRELLKEDLISGLPDDVLVHTLSFLTMQDVGKTSVLSKRWRHLWAYARVLNFDGSKILDDVEYDYDSLDVERETYSRRVDQVLSSHKAPTLDEFRLRFHLVEESKDSIDKWVIYSMDKEVKRLELDLGSFRRLPTPDTYNFPSLSFCSSLTSLKLACVDVTGEVLEKLIHDCKSLEFLSVTRSYILEELRVVGPSLKLKSFKLLYCFKLVKLEISAPNLVTIDYFGNELCSTPFKSTPKLAKLLISSDQTRLMMSSVAHQIEELKLNIPFMKDFQKFPKCPRLKMLEVDFSPPYEKDLFHVIAMIRACPLLHKLVLQMDLSCPKKYGSKLIRKPKPKPKPCPHYNLKVIEIIGFARRALRFTRYLMNNVSSLEKMVIDTQPPFDLRVDDEPEVDDSVIKARAKAEQLRTV